MDMSQFPDEKEVLLFDGCKFLVLDVQKELTAKKEPLNVITLKGEEYDRN